MGDPNARSSGMMGDLFQRLSLTWVPVGLVTLLPVHLLLAQGPALIASGSDTCLIWTDSTARKVTTFAATRRVRTYQERPVELGPTAPVRISSRSCREFLGLPRIPLLAGWRKDRCSALSFTFSPSDDADPDIRFTPPRKKWTGNRATDSPARPGDTVEITVSTVGKRPLRRMLLRGEGEILAAAEDAAPLQFTQVLTGVPAYFALSMQAQRRFLVFPVKQFATVSVVRKPRPYQRYDPPPRSNRVAIDSLVNRVELDTVGNERSSLLRVAALRQDSTILYTLREAALLGPVPTLRLDTLSRQACPGSYDFSRLHEFDARPDWLVEDTLLFQAADKTETVVGLRNPLGSHRVRIPVRIPKQIREETPENRDSLLAVAYWIGAGPELLAAYAALAGEIPPAWSQPGVSAPLAAFASGHPVVLPAVRSPGGMADRYRITYQLVEDSSQRKITSSDGGYPFGVLDGEALRGLTGEGDLRLTLRLENRHESNTYPLQLLVVAIYQTEGRGIRWVSVHP
ncbi:hypothetical protein CLV84_1025 [Neolewinella xylanilytica]|uniref:Uncharacterized protein n=1 Tax=Neolewinella xylanilytica TaxID=1514080 RepID=A0A2S6I9B1_9BACT|nr:hypothetical protein [Neolewinella xylanilytica]PPK88062.1 hypothetical protein CLV84_1025 [Neolewinella xylanilytica]